MAVTTRLTWNEEKILQKLLGNVSLSLLYKSSVHECSIQEMLNNCNNQGSTITVIYFPSSIIVGAFLLGNYPQQSESCRNQNSFYFSLKTNKTKITEFLNVELRINSEKLEFYSSNDIIFSLIPHESEVFIHSSLETLLGIGHFYSKNYLECEVFRVEGMLDIPTFSLQSLCFVGYSLSI